VKRLIPAPLRAWASHRILDPHRARAEAQIADAGLLDVEHPVHAADFDMEAVAPVLLGTGTGLYRVADGRVTQLLRGWVFGITRSEGHWIVFQSTGRFGRILRLSLAPDGVHEVVTLVSGLWSSIHQIDVVDGRILVADPRANRIVVFDLEGRFRSQSVPFGPLAAGRSSANYAHLNSVVAYGDTVHVIAHNYTQHSGRRSERLLLDRRTLELRERVPDIGSSAHNFVAADGLELTCDSGDGSLLNRGEAIFSPGTFTRGVAYDGSHILVGGSSYGTRAERMSSDGFLYVLSAELAHIGTAELRGIGPVFEVRFMDRDAGISHARAHDATAP